MSLEHAPERQGRPTHALSLTAGQVQDSYSKLAVYLTAIQVRARYGGISDMSLWRWVADPALDFLQPIYINRRRFFLLSQLDAFDALRAGTGHGRSGEGPIGGGNREGGLRPAQERAERDHGNTIDTRDGGHARGHKEKREAVGTNGLVVGLVERTGT